ncbi:unnamed protein product [Ranitomeya imitator]|uniref:Uncharacterized protein n=1 Tax=Ranitomeya imitator TaxID=111125 RepID=A0ABN9KWU5_9NEOB|nr:unnamed protein product [Ranitomeya imitator]
MTQIHDVVSLDIHYFVNIRRLGLAAVPERSEVLREDRILKPKKSTKGRSKSQKHSANSIRAFIYSALQKYSALWIFSTFSHISCFKHKDTKYGSASQVHQPAPAIYTDTRCIRRKKRTARPDPFSRLSALRDELCHRSLSDDRAAILISTEPDDCTGHATLL